MESPLESAGHEAIYHDDLLVHEWRAATPDDATSRPLTARGRVQAAFQ